MIYFITSQEVKQQKPGMSFQNSYFFKMCNCALHQVFMLYTMQYGIKKIFIGKQSLLVDTKSFRDEPVACNKIFKTKPVLQKLITAAITKNNYKALNACIMASIMVA